MVCDEASSLKRLSSQYINEDLLLTEVTPVVANEPLSMNQLINNNNNDDNTDEQTLNDILSNEFEPLPDSIDLNADIQQCVQETRSLMFSNNLTLGEPSLKNVEIQIELDNDSQTVKLDNLSIDIGNFLTNTFLYLSSY